jgi:hypothetical protein
MDRNMKKVVIGALVAIEVVSSIFAWRDLAHRSDDQVRGSKILWRVFMSLNPGNSLLYWAIGRRGGGLRDSSLETAVSDS